MTAFDEIIRAGLFVVAAAILLNGLDDIFVDLVYFVRRLSRTVTRPLAIDDLRALPQKRIAIVVPAWQESEVITEMLEHNLSTIDYDNYVIFCGTYQNDRDTQSCVERVSSRTNRVRNVVVPHDGPTSKADCLNWVYQGVLLEQERSGVAFDILLMHDAEDVIHPTALRLYNKLIPEHEFVQTPVFSLELPATHWVAGTYIDEFSEHHMKDMLVRQSLGGLVPSAGVGSGFDFRAFQEIATAHGDKPFNVDSLTEDYEIGLKFRLAGRKVCFACHTLSVGKSEPGARPRLEYIATREYFPSGFWASVRQRSRWICGITLQTWEQLGFRGPLVVRYCLMRDRKALFANAVVLGCYTLMLAMLVRFVIARLTGTGWSPDSVLAAQGTLYWLLWANVATALWRALMKVHFVSKLHGPLQASLSVPRILLGNLIGVFATSRAVAQYVKHRITGEPLRWLKTTHAFPSTSLLKARHRALGETLLSRGHLAEQDLVDALAIHRAAGLPLGEVLTTTGLAESSAVVAALAERWGMDVADELQASDLSLSLLQLLPEAEAEALDVVPCEHAANHVSVVVSEPLLPKTREVLERRFQTEVVAKLTSRAQLQRLRIAAYRRLTRESGSPGQGPSDSLRPSVRPAGERLIEAGVVTQGEVDRALAEQRRTGELFGESLLRSFQGKAESIPASMGLGHAQLQRVELDSVDVLAVYLLGYATCALYCVVPLTSGAEHTKTLASPFALSASLVERAEKRLGCHVEVVCAPALHVRAGLAHALTQARLAVGDHGFSELGGMDAEELRVIREERVSALSDSEIKRATRAAAISPIDLLVRRGELNPQTAAQLRARALGVEWVPAAAPADKTALSEPPGNTAPRVSMLPPSFLEAHDIRVVSEDGACVCLAAPRPTPALTRMAGRWLPERVIEWRVAA